MSDDEKYTVSDEIDWSEREGADGTEDEATE